MKREGHRGEGHSQGAGYSQFFAIPPPISSSLKCASRVLCPAPAQSLPIVIVAHETLNCLMVPAGFCKKPNIPPSLWVHGTSNVTINNTSTFLDFILCIPEMDFILFPPVQIHQRGDSIQHTFGVHQVMDEEQGHQGGGGARLEGIERLEVVHPVHRCGHLCGPPQWVASPPPCPPKFMSQIL